MKFLLIASLLTSLACADLTQLSDYNSAVQNKAEQLGYLPHPRMFSKVTLTNNNGFNVVSVSKNASNLSVLDYYFLANKLPRFYLRVLALSSSAVARFAMVTGLVRIAEFNDSIPPWLSPNYVNFASLPSGSWSDLLVESTVDSTGATVESIVTSFAPTTGSLAGLNVTIKAWTTDQATTINDPAFAAYDAAVFPDGFKYSLSIQNWPFQLQNSKLSLTQGIWVKGFAVNFANASLNNSLPTLVNVGTNNGRFDWNATLYVDGLPTSLTVNRTMHVNSNYTAGDTPTISTEVPEVGDAPELFDFQVPKGQSIVWDPETGVTSAGDYSVTSYSMSSRTIPFSSLLTTILAVVGLTTLLI